MPMFNRRSWPAPAPILRPSVKPLGLAGEIAAIAERTSEPTTRAALNGIVPRLASYQERADETALRLATRPVILIGQPQWLPLANNDVPRT
jgi:hypothetical protein